MYRPCAISDIESLEISSEEQAGALARIAEDGDCNRVSCSACPGSSDGKASSCTLRTFGGEIPTGNHAPLPGEIRAAMEARVARYRRENSQGTKKKQKEPANRWLTPADIEALAITTKEHLKALETIYHDRNCDAVLHCSDCPFTSGNSADQCRLRNEDGDIPVGSHQPLSPELIAAIGRKSAVLAPWPGKPAGKPAPKSKRPSELVEAAPEPAKDRLARPAPFRHFHPETEQGALEHKMRSENPRLKAAMVEAIAEAATARGVSRDVFQGIRGGQKRSIAKKILAQGDCFGVACCECTFSGEERSSATCLVRNDRGTIPGKNYGGLSEQGKALVLRYLRSGALPGDSPEAAAEF